MCREDDYESEAEHGEDEEHDEQDGGLFAPPDLHEEQKEQQNNWDILRIYTDIDEEVEYLEENYMPDEMKWHRKKRKAYQLSKLGYVEMEDADEADRSTASSIESYEERRGFEGQNHTSHWDQAHDAAQLGFIPVNEEEEYDAAASKLMHENRKENLERVLSNLYTCEIRVIFCTIVKIRVIIYTHVPASSIFHF